MASRNRWGKTAGALAGGVAVIGCLGLAGCFDTRGTLHPTGRWDAYQPEVAWDVPAVLVDLGIPDAASDDPRDLALGDPSEGPADVPRDGNGGGGCWPCSSDGDCRVGATCTPVGATKHCLQACADDGDCPRSHICYAATTAGKFCLPVSYSCPACLADEPCQAGTVCDLTTGDCKVGRPECAVCTYDFDCADGLRCYKKSGSASGSCVAECSETTPCADTNRFTCGTTDRGVQLCLPIDDASCRGCPQDRPFPSDDGLSCWECVRNVHCAKGESCFTLTHECVLSVDCMGRICTDGMCHECCQDSDCPGYGSGNPTGPCTDGRCVNKFDPCNGSCVAPYPVCEVINGTPQCVQCVTTADCRAQGMSDTCTCTGDPTYTCFDPFGSVCQAPIVEPACLVDGDCAGLGSGTCTCTGDPTYRCVEPDGLECLPPTCQAVCSMDADCPTGADGQALACTGAVGGFCHDPAGACDGQTACCPGGSACFDLASFVDGAMAGFPGWPPAGLAPIPSMCSCSDLHPCPGALACSPAEALCAIPALSDRLCPGGTKPAGLPDGVCGNLPAVIDDLSAFAGAR